MFMETKRQPLLYGLCALLLSASAVAADSQSQEDIVRETRTDSVFKGTLYQVWNRLRALSPKTNVEDAARGRVVVTAGIRGAESTDTALKPYWKDDRSNDEQYMKQLAAYSAAQDLMDKGDLKAAVASLGKFMNEYPGSELMPNAMFAEAMAFAGMGDREAGIRHFNKFIKENPKHPLRADAEAVVRELGARTQ
jgi:TolA-binding protein